MQQNGANLPSTTVGHRCKPRRDVIEVKVKHVVTQHVVAVFETEVNKQAQWLRSITYALIKVSPTSRRYLHVLSLDNSDEVKVKDDSHLKFVDLI